MTVAFTTIMWVSGVLLAVSAVLALVRMAAGPTVLDRVVASDVIVSIAIAVVAMQAVWLRQSFGLPIIIGLTMLGFTGPVALARLIARAERNRRRYEASAAAQQAAGVGQGGENR